MRVGVGENCGAELCGVVRNYLDFLDGQAERLEVRLLLPERRRRAAGAALRGRHERRCQRTEEWRTRRASTQSSRTAESS